VSIVETGMGGKPGLVEYDIVYSGERINGDASEHYKNATSAQRQRKTFLYFNPDISFEVYIFSGGNQSDGRGLVSIIY
jgi:hypothetical protein